MPSSLRRLSRAALLAVAAACTGPGASDVLVVAVVQVSPGTGSVIVGATVQLQASPRTSSGIAVPGRTPTWSSSNQNVATVSSGGVVTGVSVGPVTIRATVDGIEGSASLTVIPIPVETVEVSPGQAFVRVGESVQLGATPRSAGGQPLTGRSVLWSSDNGSIATVTTQGAVVGVAPGVTTIRATVEGKVGTAQVTVQPRPATRLGFVAQPPNGQAGQPLSPAVQVAVQDDIGATVTDATTAVTLALTTNPGGATVGGTLTANAVSGVASFGNLTLDKVGNGYVFTASALALAPAISNPFNIGSGTPAKLAMVTQPSPNATSGVAFPVQPVVQVQDANGNPVAQAGVQVTAAVATGSGALSGTLIATTNGQGQAAFVGLTLTGPAGAHTLRFTATGLTAVVSNTITLGAGSATRLAMGTQPSPVAQSGVVLGTQPTVQLQDGNGNPVGQAGVLVTATASAGGTLGGTIGVLTNGSGLAVFTDLVLSGLAGSYTLSFSAPGLTSATSGSITLSAGPAAALVISTQPSAAAVSGVPFGTQPVIQVVDDGGNPVSAAGITVTAAVATGNGAISGPATAVTNAGGAATFGGLGLLGLVGNYTVRFSATGLTSVVSGPIALSAGAPAALTILTQPAGATSGVAFTQQPVIQVVDGSGNPVSSAGISITAALASGAGALGGTLVVPTNGAGRAVFTDLAITGPAGTYTVSFSATGLTGVTSNVIGLGAGVATQLAIITQPSASVVNGVAFPTQPVVELRDGSNNPVAQAGTTVNVAVATGAGTLSGTVAVVTDGAGRATFTDLVLTGVIGARTLDFTATGLATATSDPVTVTPGTADSLVVATQPSAAAQNTIAFVQQPAIQLVDQSGNAVAEAGRNVTVSLASGGGTLNGTTTVATDGTGVATFAGLSITGTVGPRTLGFASAGLKGATSATVTLSAGPKTKLAITTQPSAAAQSGVAFPQQPVIQLQDVSGNPVSEAGVSVTAAIGTGGGALGGTTPVLTNGAGAAVFTDLAITGSAGPRTLDFNSAGLTGVTSGTVTLSAGTATKLTITTQPSGSAQAGVAFATQPVIQLRDGANNPVAEAGRLITALIATGSDTLKGTLTIATDASGKATFTDLAVNGLVGNRTIRFREPTLDSVTSNTVSITPGPKAKLGITVQPAPAAQSGVAFVQQPVIQLQDAFGNAVSEASIAISAAIETGAGGTLGGTTIALTNASGAASFSDLMLTGTSGNYTLRFSSGGLTGVVSDVIALGAGAPSKLSITTQPSDTAQNGVVFPRQPVIQLRDAANNPVDSAGVLITATIQTGNPALSGTTTVVTAAGGVATFTNLEITGSTGPRTLIFAASGFVGVASDTIHVIPGPAAALTITTQPSAAARSSLAFTQQPVIQLVDESGNLASESGHTVTAAVASGSPAITGGTSVVTNGSGTATFATLSLTGLVGDRTIGFSSAGLTGVTSSTVTLSAGPAARLSMSSQPSASAQSDSVFAQQPAVRLRDGAGNPVDSAGALISASLATGSAALGGTLTATTNGSGIAAFTNLKIAGLIGARTLRFSATGLSDTTSSTVTVTAGDERSLSITTQPPASIASGATLVPSPVVQLRDGQGNAVSKAGVGVAVALASGAGSLTGTSPVATGAAGTATFADLVITGLAGKRTLGFSATGLTGVESDTVDVTAGAAAKVTIETEPSATGRSSLALQTQPVVRLRDASNNPVNQAGVLITATIAASPGGTPGLTSATATTNGSGRATFSGLAISGLVGGYTIEMSGAGIAGKDTSTTVTLSAGPATQLSITTQPSATAQSDSVFAQQPAIQLRDGAGNVADSAGALITASLASGTVALGGALTATTNASGLATFATLEIVGVIGKRTLGFSATGLTGVQSDTVNVTAGDERALSITTQPPASIASGTTLVPNPVVQLRDGQGNAVSKAGVSVSVGLASGAGVLTGTSPVLTGAGGSASFTDLVITGAVGKRTLGFSSGSLTGAESDTVNVTAAAATKVTIETEPHATGRSSLALQTQPTVQLRDASNNPVSQAGVLITATIATSPGGTPGLTSATATTDASGLATFSGLAISGLVGGYTLEMTGAALAGKDTSTTVTLSAGPATQLSITTQPSATAQSDSVFAQQPAIQLRDGAGNVADSAGALITASLASGAVALGGTLTATTNASGLATFATLEIVGVVGKRTLGFSAAGLAGVESDTVNVTAGDEQALSITTQPPDTIASGAILVPNPVVQLVDGQGNPVSKPGVSVAAALASGDPALTGGPALTGAGGSATFSDLVITGAAGKRTLNFTATGLTAIESDTVNVTASAATKVTIEAEPHATGRSSLALQTQPTVQLRDASNNPVSQAGVLITATIASSPGGTPGLTSATASTNGSGLATFSGLAISGLVGGYTLEMSGAALAGKDTSGTVTLSAGPATQLSITTQPSATAQSDSVFAQQPAIQLRDGAGNVADSAGALITASLASGAVALGGTPTATTNASGLATFATLEIVGVIGKRTLGFSATGLTGVESDTVNVTAGDEQALSITTQPPASIGSGATLVPNPVVQLVDGQGNAVSKAGVSVGAALASGDPALTGGPALTGAGGGATFTDLVITGAAGKRTLNFTSAGLTAVESDTVNVTASAATKVTIETEPSAAGQSGVALGTQPTVQLRDASNNPVSQAGLLVTAAIVTSPGGSPGLNSATATTNASGLATFSGLAISGLVGAYTLEMSGAALAGKDTSTTVTLSPGPAFRLLVTAEASDTVRSDSLFASQPAVSVVDSVGNTVDTTGVVVSATVLTGTASLPASPTANTTNGVATFTNLELTGAAGPHTLEFTAPTIASDTSATIELIAGDATQLTLTTAPPGTANSGAALTTQPAVQLRDGQGNPVSQAGVTITAVVASKDVGGADSLSSATATTDVNGLATFSGLTLHGLAGNYTLGFNATGLTSATSGNIVLSAGAAAKLAITTQPEAAPAAGVAFSPQPIVRIEDTGGNAVASDGVSVTAVRVIVSGTGTLGGANNPVATAGGGIATFTDLSLSAAGTYNIQFDATGLLSATSILITVP